MRSSSSIAAVREPLALPPLQEGPLVSKWFYNTSTGTTIRAAPLWFFVGEGLSL
jgi:hypothetical protein